MSSFLFQKEVDQSLLKSGLTIPVNMHGKIQEAVGVQLSKGQRTGISQVYNLILRNPFNAISSHGFMVKENGENERFALQPELKDQLSETDIETIVHIVDLKLERYFVSVDSTGIGVEI